MRAKGLGFDPMSQPPCSIMGFSQCCLQGRKGGREGVNRRRKGKTQKRKKWQGVTSSVCGHTDLKLAFFIAINQKYVIKIFWQPKYYRKLLPDHIQQMYPSVHRIYTFSAGTRGYWQWDNCGLDFPLQINSEHQNWHFMPGWQHRGCRTKQECVYLWSCLFGYGILDFDSEWLNCIKKKK